MPWLWIGAAATALALGIAPAGARADAVTGTALYLERIALPPGAVFEAVLEDVSRADAAAVEIARDGGEDRAGPPFAFALPYDPAAIDPAAVYAVRARVLVDGRPMFASDEHHPVITGGAPTELEIVMRMVAADDGAAAPAPRLLRGPVTYYADSVRMTDCATGLTLPVAMELDLPALQLGVIDARTAPDAPAIAALEGRIEPRPPMEGDGEAATVIVDRFLAAWPGETCAAAADLPLAGTEWRILRLGDMALDPGEAGRRPEFLIDPATGRFAASAGCNRMMGGATITPDGLALGPVASTMMACPPPLDAAERALAEALAATRGWRIAGRALELLDGAGAPVALLLGAPAQE